MNLIQRRLNFHKSYFSGNHLLCLICLMVLNYIEVSPAAAAAAMGVGANNGERPICMYYMSDIVKSPENLSGKDQLLGDGTVLCDAPTDYCFSYWRMETSNGSSGYGNEVTNSSSFTWLARGCFKNTPLCYRESCVATDEGLESSYFCCCRGNRCNEKISYEEATHAPDVTPSDDIIVEGTPLDPLSMTLLYVVLPCLMVVMLICVSVTCYKFRRNKKCVSNTSLGLHRSPTSPCIDLNNLKFLEMIGQGRYGTVYRALLRDEEVAVKTFSPHQKPSFSNEKYIYSLPLMDHENLLSYFGGGEIISPEGNPYLGLVLSYCPRGRLSTFLQENTLDWNAFCRVVITAVKGLGHLHSDIRKGDLIKPCVAHRDFNTRNILLKEDMSCAVSDLGFAIHTQGAKFYQNGEEQIAEMASLTDVGTLRYMAPEVLEGAVNLRDCETSLKQIDIYALGLVLWEIAYRCHDLYQGMQTPNYALPFEAEIGLRPTFEQMQVLVARNKARPLLPQIWKDSSPAIKQLKETIEDCWDNDAEARLSAMCVERRLSELPKLWSRYKASLGINNISPSTNPPQTNFLNSSDVKSFLISNELSLPKDRDTQNNRESSISENTVETTIPFSPSDPSGRILGKNQLMEAVNVPPPPPIQPHQGRNPCIERNTISEHSKILQTSGNDLIKASEKYPYSNLEMGLNSANLFEVLETQHGIDPQLMNEHLVPLLNSFLPPSTHQPSQMNSNATPQPQTMPFPSPQVPPIPYVQNEMRSSEGRSKRMNVPRETERKGSGWRGIWKAAWEGRLAPFLPRRRQRNRGEDEERGILVTPTSSGFSEPPTPLSPFYSEQDCRQTQVLLSNGAPQTLISDHGSLIQSTINASNNCSEGAQDDSHSTPTLRVPSRSRIAETEIGIAKLQYQQGLSHVIRSRQGSKDSGINKSSDNSNSFLDSDCSLDRARRPTTLLIRGLASDEDLGSDGEKGDSQEIPKVKLRKPKRRIKTPRCPVKTRFSLYDDSVMGGVMSQNALEASLSRSLPLDINALGNRRSFPPPSSGSSLSGKTGSLSFRQSEKSGGSSSVTDSASGSGSSNLCKKGSPVPVPGRHVIVGDCRTE